MSPDLAVMPEVVAIIGRRLGADRPRAAERDRAAADDLYRAGLLAGGSGQFRGAVQNAVYHILRCRMDPSDAEAITDELQLAGLLNGDPR